MRLISKLKAVSPNYDTQSDLALQLTFCFLGLFSLTLNPNPWVLGAEKESCRWLWRWTPPSSAGVWGWLTVEVAGFHCYPPGVIHWPQAQCALG